MHRCLCVNEPNISGSDFCSLTVWRHTVQSCLLHHEVCLSTCLTMYNAVLPCLTFINVEHTGQTIGLLWMLKSVMEKKNSRWWAGSDGRVCKPQLSDQAACKSKHLWLHSPSISCSLSAHAASAGHASKESTIMMSLCNFAVKKEELDFGGIFVIISNTVITLSCVLCRLKESWHQQQTETMMRLLLYTLRQPAVGLFIL